MIILASGSPRRRELLSSIGIEFEVYRPDADESKIPGESPSELCRRLAGLKAEAGALAFPDDVVIAADTIVVIDSLRGLSAITSTLSGFLCVHWGRC